METLKWRWLRQVRRLVRDERGNSAVEFAFVGPLLLMWMLLTFDIAWMFTKDMALQSATREAARGIRTGAYLQEGAEAEVAFQQAFCDALLLIDCGQVHIESYNAGGDFSTRPTMVDFSAESDFSAFLSTDQIDPSYGADFSLGASSAVMVMRMTTEHEFSVPWIDWLTDDHDRRLLMATEVFQNEPF